MKRFFAIMLFLPLLFQPSHNGTGQTKPKKQPIPTVNIPDNSKLITEVDKLGDSAIQAVKEAVKPKVVYKWRTRVKYFPVYINIPDTAKSYTQDEVDTTEEIQAPIVIHDTVYIEIKTPRRSLLKRIFN